MIQASELVFGIFTDANPSPHRTPITPSQTNLATAVDGVQEGPNNSDQEPSQAAEQGSTQFALVETETTNSLPEQFTGQGKLQLQSGCVYDGTFLSGLMHGKGKLVWPDQVVYEGDFKSNDMTGQGSFRWFDFLLK
jgi:hypothetical protein